MLRARSVAFPAIATGVAPQKAGVHDTQRRARGNRRRGLPPPVHADKQRSLAASCASRRGCRGPGAVHRLRHCQPEPPCPAPRSRDKVCRRAASAMVSKARRPACPAPASRSTTSHRLQRTSAPTSRPTAPAVSASSVAIAHLFDPAPAVPVRQPRRLQRLRPRPFAPAAARAPSTSSRRQSSRARPPEFDTGNMRAFRRAFTACR
jgi:hypothetical protein